MAGIAFFFEYEYENQVVMLPVNPEELTVKMGGRNQTTEVLELGEINMLRTRALREIVIESYFPKNPDYPWILTKGEFEGPQFYIDFFNKIRNKQKPCRLIVTGTDVNILMAIENFTYSHIAQDDDIAYSLELKEYKAYAPMTMTLKTETKTTAAAAPAKAVQQPKPRENAKLAVTVGCSVVVNGVLHRDSDGQGPGATKKDFTGKVNFIKTGKGFPYHITTPSGGWQGWVIASAVKVLG